MLVQAIRDTEAAVTIWDVRVTAIVEQLYDPSHPVILLHFCNIVEGMRAYAASFRLWLGK